MNLTIRILGYPLLEIWSDTDEQAETGPGDAGSYIERADETGDVEDRVGFRG